MKISSSLLFTCFMVLLPQVYAKTVVIPANTYFVKIQGKGTLHVTRGSTARQKIRLFHGAQYRIKDHTLMVTLPQKKDEATLVVQEIESIDISDNSQLDAQGIGIHALWVEPENTRRHQCYHIHDLRHMTHEGQGDMRILGLQAKKLSIFMADKSSAHFVGVCDRLMLKLNDKSAFFGPFLRATRTWVMAKDDAKAQLNPIHLLHAYAKDRSQITYFHYLVAGQLYRQVYDEANVVYHPPGRLL